MFATVAVALAVACSAGTAWAGNRVQRSLVQTAYGPVQGYVSGNSVMWTGIRYAVAERFEKPIAPPSFTDTYAADFSAPACMQPGDQFFMPGLSITIPAKSEDCLFAEIYAPRFVHGHGRLSPVTVVFQGNTRWTNDMTAMNASAYSDRGNVVVVFNYRMGYSGLLVEDGIETNLWFHDQMALLDYVSANIAAFGGDPNRMTYECQFSNCQDVMLHIRTGSTSPQPKNVLMDNLADVAWLHANVTRGITKVWQSDPRIACNQSTAVERVACLKSLTPEQLFSATVGFNTVLPRASYGQGTLFEKEPMQYMRDGDYNKRVRFMAITPEDPGKSFIPFITGALFGQILPFAAIPDTLTANLLIGYHVGRIHAPPTIIPALLATYLPMLQDPGMNAALVLAQSIGDHLYNCALQELEYILRRDGVRVYAALFTHGPDNSTVTIPYPDLDGTSGYGLLTSFLMGDDQARGFPQWVESFSSREADLVDILMDWTSNFAKTGKPRDGWKRSSRGYNSIGINSIEDTDMVSPPFYGSRCTDVWAQSRGGTPLILTPPSTSTSTSTSPDEMPGSARRAKSIDFDFNALLSEMRSTLRGNAAA